MAFLLSLADARDVIVIIYGVMGIVLFFLGIILAAILIKVLLNLKGTVSDLVNDSVKPTLDSIKETAASIKGTTEFVGDKAVSPIIKTYGMASGVRRGLGVLTGLSKRRRG